MRLRYILVLMLVAAAFSIVTAGGVSEAATLANTTVSNRASVVYSDEGGGPTTIESSPTGNTTTGATQGTDTTFKVDALVDLTVTGPGTYTSVATPSNDQVLQFTVTNNSNATLDFSLEAIATASTTADPHGGTDNFDLSVAPSPFVETAGGAGYQLASDTTSYINDLAPGASIVVYIVGDVQGSLTNGDIAAYALRATAADPTGTLIANGAAITETAGLGLTGTVEYVFNDGDGDEGGQTNDSTKNGKHVARGAYKVYTPASLTVTKTSAVYSDPVNGTGANRKYIPGAIVTYTVTVANAGSTATATSVTITDDLSTAIASGVTFKTQFGDGATTCAAGEGIVYDGTCYTNAADAGSPDVKLVGNIVTVTGITIPASTTRTIKYQIQVNP